MKKREFKNKQYYEELVNDFIKENRPTILQHLLEKTGFNSIEELSNAEQQCYFGFDCGLVEFEPKDDKMMREWRLDNGKYNTDFLPRYPFNCQSTTIQKVMANYILDKLNLNELQIKTWID